MVEHLPPQGVIDVVRLAAEKVRPGGRVVFETVNPTALSTYANAFWVDTDHVRPVYPAFLAFLFREAGFAEVERMDRSVLPADPDREYDLDAVMAAIVDPGSWSRDDASRSGLATGTARIGGVTLSVIGSDAAVGDGRIDGAGASAARERVAHAGTAGEPLLFIIDSPGPALGVEAESAGTLRAIMELARAVRATQVPVIAVVLRRAHGDVPTILGLGAGGPSVLSVGRSEEHTSELQSH